MVPTHFQRLLDLPVDLREKCDLVQKIARKITGSVGTVLPPFEAAIVSKDGKVLMPNEIGDLYFRDTSGRGIVYYWISSTRRRYAENNGPQVVQSVDRGPAPIRFSQSVLLTAH